MKIRPSPPPKVSVPRAHDAAPPVRTRAAPAPAVRAEAYDRVFTRTSGWTGADGAYSVPLTSGKTLWLFSDTLVGKVTPQGHRVLDARVPVNVLGVRALHNSAAVQDSADPASIRFVVPGGEAAPRNLFDPPDGQGWFWVSAGVPNADGSATVLLNQFVKVDDPQLPFGKVKAVWACDVRVEGDEVKASGYRRLDSLGHMASPETVFGAATLVDGPWTYVYGARGIQTKDLVVARVASGQVGDPQAYRFFDGKGWQTNLEQVRALPVSVSNEFSVQKVKGGYVMTSDTMSGPINLRFSPTPVGPWSAPQTVWQPPEPAGKVFTYNAKAHPQLADADGLLVSYNVNSLEEHQSLHQADVYRPRFVRVPLSRLAPSAFTD